MNKLFIMMNLGLGDAIISNGMIRELAKQYTGICFSCWRHNLASVTSMFSDVSNIAVHPIDNDKDIFDMERDHCNFGDWEILKIGTYSDEYHVEPESFDQTFYRQAGIPFSKRWDSFHLPEIKPLFKGFHGEYALICDSPERGFKIDDSKIRPDLVKIRMRQSTTLFHFRDLIANAAELHCINSAPAILADSIPTNGKLFLHRYARPCTPYDNFKVRKIWEIL